MPPVPSTPPAAPVADVATAGSSSGGAPEPSGSAVDRLLDAERATFERVPAADLAAEVAAGALVVDIRSDTDRRRDGELPDAIVIDRLVLEWRLDPTSPHRLPGLTDADRRVVLVCNEGYASSLAAATLRRLGLRNATDLVGGHRAWRALPGT